MTLHAEEREKPLFFCDGHGLLMAPKHKAQLGPSSTTWANETGFGDLAWEVDHPEKKNAFKNPIRQTFKQTFGI